MVHRARDGPKYLARRDLHNQYTLSSIARRNLGPMTVAPILGRVTPMN